MDREFARTGCLPDYTDEDRSFWEQPQRLEGITMRLNNRDLWQKFYAIGTEMIITKPGRRMFPCVEVNLEGLDPEESYVIVLELRQSAECRFRFQNNCWVEGARSSFPVRTVDNMYVLSPKKGRELMQGCVSLHFVKITNCSDRHHQKSNEDRPLLLTSMHKYLPTVHIIKTDSKYSLTKRPMSSFIIPEGEFMAVTAYQNVAVKFLKIENNPFAKAFRPGATSNRKRRSDQTLETSDGASTSASSASPCSPTTSSPAVETKVEDGAEYQTPTTSQSCSGCSPNYNLCPLPYHPAYQQQDHVTRMAEMMQRYMLMRPWEAPPLAVSTSYPYPPCNIPYPIPVYWDSFGYHLPRSTFYPALPAPPPYPYENELMDLSVRTQDKEGIEENPD